MTRPRPELALVSAMVSQLTCLAVLGIDSRRYLEELVPQCASVVKLGKLRLVEVDDALRALRAMTPTESAATANAENDQGEPEPDLLAGFGRRRA